VITVALGRTSGAALVDPGTVLTWTSSMGPTPVSGLTGEVTAVATGAGFQCVLFASGGVACWGNNMYGALGDGTNTDRLTPTPVCGLDSGVRAITAGGASACALTEAGGVLCWGRNWEGQLGIGATGDTRVPTPVVGLDSGVSAITAGDWHACALLDTGAVRCWGRGTSGQLGDESRVYRFSPVAVTGQSAQAIAIGAGGEHTCALTRGGTIECWGFNIAGELGDGTTVTRTTPVAVTGLAGKATALALGRRHTCALLESGSVQCWGANVWGQLGNCNTAQSNVPVTVVR
jgi:alpha-tubulin suppressor-like RCC1 family protein